MTVDRQAIDDVAARVRPSYRRFLERDELLMTGHSHQAWPDVSRDGHLAAWDDAAALVDGKWGKIFEEILPEFRRHIATRLGTARPDDIAIAPNSHELAYRLSTCFPRDGTIVTTDAEFHSLARQLARLAEEGLEIIEVPAEAPDFAARFVDAVKANDPAWCAVSSVLFTTSRIVEGIDEIAEHLAGVNVPLLVDAYHGFNVVQMHADRWPGHVFVSGGGYKYAQSGEGACFMLLPKDASTFRPLTTGWFADFAGLESASAEVRYGPGGDRFFGATFDPSALYRAVYTFRHMNTLGLDVATLEAAARLRTSLIVEEYDRLALADRGVVLASPRDPAARGGFVSFSTPDAASLGARLAERRVRTDHRGSLLRFGPAPYTTSEEIVRAMTTFGDLCA